MGKNKDKKGQKAVVVEEVKDQNPVTEVVETNVETQGVETGTAPTPEPVKELTFAEKLKAKKLEQKKELEQLREQEKARKEQEKAQRVGGVSNPKGNGFTRVDAIAQTIQEMGYIFPKGLENLATRSDTTYATHDNKKKSNPKETLFILQRVVPALVKLGFAKVDKGFVSVAQLTDQGWIFAEPPVEEKKEETPAS